MFVDSHCHLDRLKQGPEELAETLNFARTRGVEHFLCVCVSVGDYDSMLAAVSQFEDVSVSCGVHPLHQDEAWDTINLLREHKAAHTKGVLHCFTESLEMAQAAIEMDFYISISGIVTFNSADELREVVKAIPLERLLIETDSPWLAPVPHRGKQNQPGYVVEVAEFIAELKGVSVKELAEITTQNFYTLFSLAGKKKAA